MPGGGIKVNNISVRGGADGATYIPNVDNNGNLSWSNNKGYANPPTVNIKGVDGAEGKKGATGAKLVSQVLQGQDANGGNIYLQTFDDGNTATFVAPKGDKGDKGDKDDIVQTKGTSTTVVMSQNAVTTEINKLWEEINYISPTISTFILTGNIVKDGKNLSLGSTSFPYDINITKLSHAETNTKYIKDNLTLTGSGLTSSLSIIPKETITDINGTNFTFTNVGSSKTWTLKGTDTKDNVFQKTISITGYWYSFYGSSSNDKISKDLITNLVKYASSRLSGSFTITTKANDYVWFVTTQPITKVTSSGFDVPITLDKSNFEYYDGWQNYYCYRTTSALQAGDNTFVIS